MHFVAGPWFTVHKSGDDWQKLGQVWISNGSTDCKGHIEIKIELKRPDSLVEDVGKLPKRTPAISRSILYPESLAGQAITKHSLED